MERNTEYWKILLNNLIFRIDKIVDGNSMKGYTWEAKKCLRI